MANKNQFTAEQFIKAIKGSGGIVTVISKRVGCDWHTAKKYINEYVTIKQAYDDECENVIDVAESVVLTNIQMAAKEQEENKKPVDSGDAKWWLSRKAKERGYADKVEQEITGPDGGAIIVDWDAKPTDTD